MTDMRYGGRTLARNPAFGAIVIIILAVGIGANTVMFSVLHSVLVRPLGDVVHGAHVERNPLAPLAAGPPRRALKPRPFSRTLRPP